MRSNLKIQNLILEYRNQVKICFNINYDDKKSILANNRAVSKMYKLIEKLKNYSKSDFDLFTNLLDEEDTNLWVAPQLLEKIALEKSVEEKALKIIKDVINSNSSNSLSFKFWLNDWNEMRKIHIIKSKLP